MVEFELYRGRAEVYDDKIIKKVKALFLVQPAQERTFYFDQIRAIEKNKKRRMISDAYIELDIGGGSSDRVPCTSDNALQFCSDEEMEEAYNVIIKKYNNYRARNKNQNIGISGADELKKYKELLDMNIITQEEFNAKKKEILGL